MGAYNLYSFSEDTDSGKLYKTQHACHNKRLLQDILRKEWGFDGVVITDYATTHELIAHGVAENDADVGMDIDMQTSYYCQR